MAIYKTGITNSSNGVVTSTASTTSDLTNQLLSLQNFIISARVIDIVLDENHPYFNKVGQWNGIGAIFFEIVTIANR